MAKHFESQSPTPEEIAAHYSSGYERNRLNTRSGKLERERARDRLKPFDSPEFLFAIKHEEQEVTSGNRNRLS